MDTSTLGQTLAIIDFHRKYMKHVFTSDELDQFVKLKKEARRQKKYIKQQKNITTGRVVTVIDPLKQLEAFRTQKQGIEEPRPFGIDRVETIKVMSAMADKEMEVKKQSKEQMLRILTNRITMEATTGKR